jgi:hypothetical protein
MLLRHDCYLPIPSAIHIRSPVVTVHCTSRGLLNLFFLVLVPFPRLPGSQQLLASQYHAPSRSMCPAPDPGCSGSRQAMFPCRPLQVPLLRPHPLQPNRSGASAGPRLQISGFIMIVNSKLTQCIYAHIYT